MQNIDCSLCALFCGTDSLWLITCLYRVVCIGCEFVCVRVFAAGCVGHECPRGSRTFKVM